MSDPSSWPLPASIGIDQTVYDLTEHASFYVNEDDFDAVFAEAPHLVLAWLSAAARYAAADYQLQMLARPINWMRDSIGLESGYDTDEITVSVENLRRLLDHHSQAVNTRDDALRGFTAACKPLTAEGLLMPDDRTWRDITLIAHGLTEPAQVQVPYDAKAPWPLVKATPALILQLCEPRPPRAPEPGVPVVRKVYGSFARLDHDGTWRRLLPDQHGWYWLHGFAWSQPEPPPPAPADSAATEPPPAA